MWSGVMNMEDDKVSEHFGVWTLWVNRASYKKCVVNGTDRTVGQDLNSIWEFYGPVNTVQVMLCLSINKLPFFLGSLSPLSC